jgi:hypothetical protein
LKLEKEESSYLEKDFNNPEKNKDEETKSNMIIESSESSDIQSSQFTRENENYEIGPNENNNPNAIEKIKRNKRIPNEQDKIIMITHEDQTKNQELSHQEKFEPKQNKTRKLYFLRNVISTIFTPKNIFRMVVIFSALIFAKYQTFQGKKKGQIKIW